MYDQLPGHGKRPEVNHDAHAFRIIHLSDLHLTADDSARRTEPKLYGRLTGMNAAFRRIVQTREVQRAHLILVTGDITDRGETEAWEHFWHATRDAAISANRIIALPGNHDVCCLGIRRLSLDAKGHGNEDIDKAVDGLTLGRQPTVFPWARVPDPRLVVFGLNSNNLVNFSAVDNALGTIGFHQLESFARLLRKYKDIPVKIVTLHHSPNLPEPETMMKRFGKDHHIFNRFFSAIPQHQRRALRLLCVAHGVRLIAHGHLHLAEDRKVNGVRIVGAPPTTESNHPDSARMTYPFYSYTITGPKNRVLVRLLNVSP